MISLLAHKMKSPNKTFTLVSAGFETCQDRQRRLLFDEKMVMRQSRDMLSYHVNTQIVGRYIIIIFSEGFGALQWKKMKFEVNFCLSPIYLVSGTTIRDYIVSYLKEQVLVYQNQLSNLFCQVG